MIKMRNWHVCVPECDQSIGYDGENLVYRLQIETDSPPEWAYKLDLRYLDGQKNYLELIYTDGVLYVDILRDYLRPGSVKAQIRALNGEQEKHSDQFDLYVKSSINAPGAFELTEPSAFAQLEQRLTGLKQDAEAAADRAESAADRAESGGGSVDLKPATKSTLGGIIVGDNLTVDMNGRVSVETADEVEQDNTKPITAAAVHTVVGNIDVLLSLI